MENLKQQKIYCSLDIETSGFDPLKNEILEVGFVFFELGEKGFKVTKEWTSVFKPLKQVPANILGLTGITLDELDKAPDFTEHKEFLQGSLGSAVIVGHNVNFDIKFLESFGITFSGEVLDTLDLVQFLMPTHHSYNLENLMHTFGIEHKDAHRALADSKAALLVLEKMIRLFWGFPEILQHKMTDFMELHAAPYKDLFLVKLQPDAVVSKKNEPKKDSVEKIMFESNRVYNLPLGNGLVSSTALRLQKPQEKVLLVVPKIQQVMALWKQGLLGQALFSPEVQFNETKFTALVNKKELMPDQVKFALKILVWKYTNWQTNTILDLNLSFFGGQFRTLVTGGKFPARLTPGLVCCDQQTFLSLSKLGLYNSRFVVIIGLSEFEQQASSNISTKVSWGYITYLLKSVYNPELPAGEEKFKETVEQGLLAGDLFFGLVNALLQSDPPGYLYYKINSETEYSTEYQKIKQAAASFCEKLVQLNKVLKIDDILRYSENLNGFFDNKPNCVKWIELAENRCTFFSSPLNITGVVKNILTPYQKVCFIDSLGTDQLSNYFITRLGIGHFPVVQMFLGAVKEAPQAQGDLFRSAKKLLPFFDTKPPAPSLNCFYRPSALHGEEIIRMLGKKSFPAAVLFGNQVQVKQFYESNYQQLSKRVSLFSQSVSGGGNKIFRNFSINHNSLLLATDKFILKQVQVQGAVDPVELLPIRTLIICHLPFEQFTHPYQEALSAQFANPFEDFSLPKAVYNFHCILKFFVTPELRDIYICDPKLAKGYAKSFREYLQQLPNIKWVEEKQ